MATDTLPTFQASVEGEPTYLVRYPHEGVTHVVGFDTLNELIQIVVDYRDEWKRPLPTDLINLIVDFAEESMEWNDRPPVAEAVTDCSCQDCQCGINARLCEPSEPPAWQLYLRGVVWCGMLAMPWVAAWYLGPPAVRWAVATWRAWA